MYIKQMSFREQHTFEQRKKEASRIISKYPDRIPVICEKDPNSNISSLEKTKFLVPREFTVSQFICIIRKQFTLRPEEAIFLTVNNTIPAATAIMSSIYEEHRDIDYFLYFLIQRENVFG